MPIRKIDQDTTRFKDIVRGRIKENLRKEVTSGEMVGRQGKRYVSIPVHGIEIPHFRYGDNDDAGVGKGDGKPGDTVGDEGGLGVGGDQEGRHILEVDVSLNELADILGEELELPRIEPKGKHRITSERDRYSGVRRSGPESLRHFKRTLQRAL